MARKIRLFLVIIILIVSCTLLIWGVWPEEREIRSEPIQPTQMQLPTPVSLLFDPYSAG